MHANHIQEIKEENVAWQSTLDLMDQECVQMKTRLSRLLELNSDMAVLESAEQFQNQILMKEEALILMRQDLRAQDLRIQSFTTAPSQGIDRLLLEKQAQIRTQINYLKKECLQMQENFNEYVTKHMTQS